MRATIQVSVNKISQKQGIYPRFRMDYERINMFADLMEAGDKFPPVKVVKNGDFYVLLDGNHRLETWKKLGKEKIPADVFKIPERLWRLAAARFNGKSSMPLKSIELKRVIESAWMIDKIHDTYEIARELGCSDRYVRKVLQPIREQEKQKLEHKVKKMRDSGDSQREVAKNVGLSNAAISKMEKKNSKVLTYGTVPLVNTPTLLELPGGQCGKEVECEIPVVQSDLTPKQAASDIDTSEKKADLTLENTMKSENPPTTSETAVKKDGEEPFPLSALDDSEYPDMVPWKPGWKKTHRALDLIGARWSVDKITQRVDVSPVWVRNTAVALLYIYHYGRNKSTTAEIAEEYGIEEVRVEYLLWLNTYFTALPPTREVLLLWLQDYPPRNQDSKFQALVRREQIYEKCKREGKKPPWEYQENMPRPFVEIPRDIADKFYNAADSVNAIVKLVSLGLFQEEKVEKDLLGKFNVLCAAMNNLRDAMKEKEYLTRYDEDDMKLRAYNYIHQSDKNTATG